MGLRLSSVPGARTSILWLEQTSRPPFDDRRNPISCHIDPLLRPAARPADREAVGVRGGAQAEVDAQVVGGSVAISGADFVALRDAGGRDADPGANGIAVAVGADEF